VILLGIAQQATARLQRTKTPLAFAGRIHLAQILLIFGAKAAKKQFSHYFKALFSE